MFQLEGKCYALGPIIFKICKFYPNYENILIYFITNSISSVVTNSYNRCVSTGIGAQEQYLFEFN